MKVTYRTIDQRRWYIMSRRYVSYKGIKKNEIELKLKLIIQNSTINSTIKLELKFKPSIEFNNKIKNKIKLKFKYCIESNNKIKNKIETKIETQYKIQQ